MARARQSPVNTGVTQQESNDAEVRLLQNSIISANEEEASRLRRKRLENLHLDKAIAESKLYVVGPRRRAHVDYHEVNPPPASRQRRRVSSSFHSESSWCEVPVVQGFPITPP